MPSSPACTCLSCPVHDRGPATRCGVYPASSITNAQWAVLEPLLPAAGNTRGRGGRPEKHPRRRVLDAIFYLVRGGIAWAALPQEFPPHQTVYGLFGRWARAGAWQTVHDAPRDLVRVHEGRDPAPTAAIIDSQSVRGADTVPGRRRGYDAGNHAGRAVMPGSLLPVGVAAAQLGEAGARPGITTGSRGRRVAGRAGGIELVLLPGVRCGPGPLPSVRSRRAGRPGSLWSRRGRATPSASANTTTIQTRTRWATVSEPSIPASTAEVACVASSRRRLSIRSATSPPYGAATSTGTNCAATTTPSKVAEPVRSAPAPARTAPPPASRSRPNSPPAPRSTTGSSEPRMQQRHSRPAAQPPSRPGPHSAGERRPGPLAPHPGRIATSSS